MPQATQKPRALQEPQALVDDPRLDPEMRAAIEETAEFDRRAATTPVEMRRVYADERRHWNHPLPSMKTVENLSIDGPHGRLKLQMLHPPIPGPSPAVVFLHGGGWVVGSIATHARIMRVLAERAGAVVLGVDYRLSPEHRFPVALEEACAAVRWLREHGTPMGVDVDRIALAGDSAGANLAAATALSLEGGPGHHALRALGLLYGTFGLTDSPSMRELGQFDTGLSAAAMRYYYDAYLGPDGPRDDPRFNLLQADVSRLPPAKLVAAELDPLLDDSYAMAAHLEAAGVDNEIATAPGLVHGFAHMTRSVTEARDQVYALASWLSAKLN